MDWIAPFCSATPSTSGAVWLPVDALPDTVNGYRLGIIVAVVVTVSCDVPAAVIFVGLNEHVAELGRPEQANITCPLNPFTAVIVTVDNALLPAAMIVGEREAAEIWKS